MDENKHSDDAGAQNQPAIIPAKGDPCTPEHCNAPAEEKHGVSSSRAQPSWSNIPFDRWVELAFTCVIAVATSAYFIVSCNQLSLMRQGFQLTDRPWVGIKETMAPISSDGRLIETLGIRNFGNSTATHVFPYTSLMIATKDYPVTIPREYNSGTPFGAIFPGTGPLLTQNIKSTPDQPTILEEIQNPQSKFDVQLWLYLEYWDQAGERHGTIACVKLQSYKHAPAEMCMSEAW